MFWRKGYKWEEIRIPTKPVTIDIIYSCFTNVENVWEYWRALKSLNHTFFNLATDKQKLLIYSIVDYAEGFAQWF